MPNLPGRARAIPIRSALISTSERRRGITPSSESAITPSFSTPAYNQKRETRNQKLLFVHLAGAGRLCADRIVTSLQQTASGWTLHDALDGRRRVDLSLFSWSADTSRRIFFSLTPHCRGRY